MKAAMWTDDDLREMLSEGGKENRSRRDCPESDLIWQAAANELPPEETRELMSHIAGCPFCAQAWGLATDLGAKGERQVETKGALAERESWRLSRYIPHFAAAAVVLIIASVTAPRMFQTDVELPTDAWRGSSPELTSSMASDEVLSPDNAILRWHGTEADQFDLLVTWNIPDDGGVIEEVTGIAASPSGDTTYRIPEAALTGIPAGAEIFWHVTARSGLEVVDVRSFSARLEGADPAH